MLFIKQPDGLLLEYLEKHDLGHLHDISVDQDAFDVAFAHARAQHPEISLPEVTAKVLFRLIWKEHGVIASATTAKGSQPVEEQTGRRVVEVQQAVKKALPDLHAALQAINANLVTAETSKVEHHEERLALQKERHESVMTLARIIRAAIIGDSERQYRMEQKKLKRGTEFGSAIVFLLVVIAIILLFSGRAHAQLGTPGAIPGGVSRIELFEAGVSKGVASGSVGLNFSTGCGISKSGNTFVIACTGGAGGSPGGSGSEIQYRGGASTFSAVTGSSVSGGKITLGDQLFAPDGLVGTPSYSFSGATGLGFFRSTGNIVDFAAAGATVFRMSPNGFFVIASAGHGVEVSSTNGFLMNNGTAGTGTVDTAIWRLGAGSFAFGNGTSGDFSASLKATIVNAVTGFQINGAAASGNVLRGNATNFVSAQLAYSDLSGTPTLPATLANAANKWLNSYTSTTGLFTQTQPAFTDISGSVAAGQMPALTGDVTTSAGAVATTLASVVSASTCGDTTHSCGLTYDAKGRITAATNNVISGGTGFNPLDSTVSWLREDFYTSSNVGRSDIVGNNSWLAAYIGGASSGNVGYTPGSYPNLGILQIIPDGTANHGAAIVLDSNGPGFKQPLGNMGGNTNWDMYFIFKLSQTTVEIMRLGVFNDISSATPVGMWIRYSTTAGDTSFTFEANDGTATTSTTNSIAVNTTFNCARIRSTVAGTVKFSIGATCAALGTETSISTHVPTSAMAPGWQFIQTTTTTAPTLNADFFAIQFTGLSR